MFFLTSRRFVSERRALPPRCGGACWEEVLHNTERGAFVLIAAGRYRVWYEDEGGWGGLSCPASVCVLLVRLETRSAGRRNKPTRCFAQGHLNTQPSLDEPDQTLSFLRAWASAGLSATLCKVTGVSGTNLISVFTVSRRTRKQSDR